MSYYTTSLAAIYSAIYSADYPAVPAAYNRADKPSVCATGKNTFYATVIPTNVYSN